MNKKGKTGKTIDEIVKNPFSPIVQALKDDDFETFEQVFEKMLSGEEEPLGYDDRVDALGFSFVHNLCLVKDYLFIDMMLHEWEGQPDKVKKVFYIQDINEEMNRYHPVSGYTPITGILANGSKEMVDYILTKIFIERAIKIDISHLDCRGRNIIHLITGNKHIDPNFKLDIFNKNISVLVEGLLYNWISDNVDQMYNKIDDDGFSPLVSYLIQLTPNSQKETTVQLILEFLVEKTSFEDTIFTVAAGPLVHPFIPWIQLGLNEIYNKLIMLKPDLLSTVFFWDYSSGRTTLEFAFTSKSLFFIEQTVKSIERIASFIVHNNTRTLFDICESIFVQLKEENEVPLKDQDDKNKNKDQPTTIFDWYKRLVQMVYTETRSSSGSKASHILEKFKINKDPKPSIERKEVKKLPKIPKKIKRLIGESNDRSILKNVTVQIQQRKVTSYDSLFKLAYKNDNFVSLPYITDIGR